MLLFSGERAFFTTTVAAVQLRTGDVALTQSPGIRVFSVSLISVECFMLLFVSSSSHTRQTLRVGAHVGLRALSNEPDSDETT